MNYYGYDRSEIIRRSKSILMRSVFMDSLLIGGALLLCLALQLILPMFWIALLPGNMIERAQNLANDYLATAILSGISVVIPFSILAVIKRPGIKYVYTPKKADPAVCVALFASAVGVFMVGNYITELFTELLNAVGITISEDFLPVPEGNLEKTIYCFSIALIPAVCEEFGFRAVSLQTLRRYGDGFAIVITSILFAMLHANFQQIIFAMICGLALGFVTVKSGSIYIAMAAHFFNNLLSAIIETCGINSVFENIIKLVLIAIGGIALITLIISKNIALKPSQKLPVGRLSLAGMFFVSPLTLISMLILLVIAVAFVFII